MSLSFIKEAANQSKKQSVLQREEEGEKSGFEGSCSFLLLQIKSREIFLDKVPDYYCLCHCRESSCRKGKLKRKRDATQRKHLAWILPLISVSSAAVGLFAGHMGCLSKLKCYKKSITTKKKVLFQHYATLCPNSLANFNISVTLSTQIQGY